MVEAAILVIFPFCMVYAAVSDTLSMTIANRVPLLLAGAFLVLAPLAGMEWSTYGMHVAAGAAVLCAGFALFALGAMGGGDAKLLSATALWIGLGMPLMEYLLYSAMLGGVLTLAIVAYRASPVSHVTGGNLFLRHFADPKAGIPYGVALGAAGLILAPQTPLMAWAIARIAGA